MRTIKIWKESLDVDVSVLEQRFCSTGINVQERHQERNKAVTSPLEDLQEGGKERCAECESDQPTFDSIHDKQPRGCLVEPVLFLENEGLISGKWNAWDRGDKE